MPSKLKARLSRITYSQACRLLGRDGEHLLREGGEFDIDPFADVTIDGERAQFRVNGAVATIRSTTSGQRRLECTCNQCNGPCLHAGAALALLLEEKVALGLAVPPITSRPLESLSESELVERAVQDRSERAAKEKMRVRSTDTSTPWADYVVTNAGSGKSYRVALRGWAPGESYCSCPDFRTNTLGLCKHVLKVQSRVKSRFSKAVLRKPFQRHDFAVSLDYRDAITLRLLTPTNCDAAARKIARKFLNDPIDDIDGLLRCIARLEKAGHPVTVFPDAEAYINEQLYRRQMAAKVGEIRRDPTRHPLRKKLLKAELLPYQLDGIAFAAGAGRALLADDMGLGKTIQAIGLAEFLAQERGIERVLVVCPASVKSQWRSEIERFCARPCQLIVGGKLERAEQYDNDCFFTICNYEQVLRDIDAIEAGRWDLIILDEAQRIKNWEAKTSRVIKSLRSPFALVLTGTPLENRLDELYSIVQFIDDRQLGPAFRFFHRHRTVDVDGRVDGYQNLDELRSSLAPIMLRRTRQSVMRELPPRSTELVRVAPTEEQFNVHQANLRVVRQVVNKPYFTEMDLLRLRKALLNCRMAADSSFLVTKKAPGYSSKLERLSELLADLLAEEDRKIVLFSEWTGMLDLVEVVLAKHAAGSVRLDGKVPQKHRAKLVAEFKDNPACRLFLTTNAGATGLNLQAANTVINVDLPWNPAVLEQRIGRAHRMGQRRPVQVYLLITERTLEEGLLATLGAKQKLADAALDIDSTVSALDMVSRGDELKQRLETLLGPAEAAPEDRSEFDRVATEAERLSRRNEVAEAGGELVVAAFNLLSKLAPELTGSSDNESRSAADGVRRRMAEIVERDDAGRPRLLLTLPDDKALDQMASVLGSLLRTEARNSR